MSECQNVRMSECQDAGHDGSEERRGGDGLPDAVEAARVTGGERLRASPGGGGPHSPSIACHGAGHASRGVWEMMERKWFLQCPTHLSAMFDTPGTVVMKTVFR